VAAHGAGRSDESGGPSTRRTNPRRATGGDAVGAFGKRKADPKSEKSLALESGARDLKVEKRKRRGSLEEKIEDTPG
jgi:hypothetical protein